MNIDAAPFHTNSYRRRLVGSMVSKSRGVSLYMSFYIPDLYSETFLFMYGPLPLLLSLVENHSLPTRLPLVCPIHVSHDFWTFFCFCSSCVTFAPHPSSAREVDAPFCCMHVVLLRKRYPRFRPKGLAAWHGTRTHAHTYTHREREKERERDTDSQKDESASEVNR